MSQKLTILLLFCVVILALLAGWWIAADDGSPALTVASQPADAQGGLPQHALDKPKGADKFDEMSSDSKTNPAEENSTEPKPNHWRITGQLVKAFTGKYQPLDDLKLSDVGMELQTILDTKADTEEYKFDDIELDDEGNFSFDVPKESLPNIDGHWRVDYEFDVSDTFDVDNWYDFEDWEFDDGTIDLSQVHNLLSPIVEGDTLNLGIINLSPDTVLYQDDECEQLIHGRIVHTSGTPVAHWFDACLVRAWIKDGVVLGSSDWNDSSIPTDKDGYFYALVDLGERPFDNYDLHIHDDRDINEDALIKDEVYAYNIQKPTLVDGVWNFGTIEVGACLVEVQFVGEGRDRLERRLDLEMKSRDINTDFDVDTQLSYFIIPAGRYKWECWLTNKQHRFEPQEGVLDVVGTGTNTLTINVIEHPALRVRVSLDRPKHGPAAETSVIMCYVSGVDFDDRYGDDSPALFKLPLDKGPLQVRFSAKHYRDYTIQFSPKDEVPEIRLQPLELIPVTVTLPTIPEKAGVDRITAKLTWRWKKVATNGVEHKRLASVDVSLRKKSQQHILYVNISKAALYTVSISELERWGFAKGAVVPTVSIEVTEQGPNTISFGELPIPPWGNTMQREYYYLTIDGRPAEMSGLFATRHDGTKHFSEFDNNTYNGGLPKQIIGIIDGEETIDADLVPPSKNSRYSKITLALDSRISANVTFHGKPVSKVTFVAFSARYRCLQDSEDGEGALWLPAGEATVRAIYNGFMEEKTVTVVAGGSVSVSFDFDLCNVIFKAPKQAQDRSLYRRLADGHLDRAGIAEAGKSRLMRVGDYVIVDDLSGNTSSFVVKPDDKELVIVFEVDERDVSQGSLILTTDPFTEYAKGDVITDVDYELYYLVPTGNLMIDMGGWADHHPISTRQTPEGLVLMNLPQNMKICIFGTVGGETSDDDPSRILKPFVITLARDGEMIPANWLKCIEFNWWREESSMITSWVDGVAIECDDWLPVGRHEFAFYDDSNRIILREWITIPAQPEDGRYFVLPESIKKRLAELRSTID